MDDLQEKVIRGLKAHAVIGMCGYNCPYYDCSGQGICSEMLCADALSLLKAQEPRVLTLEEVIEHYSLPPVFPDDLGMRFDFYEDIQPLYFDFPHPEDPWIVHWRGYAQIGKYLDDWKADYGKTWRCWTARPTDEQREATQWE